MILLVACAEGAPPRLAKDEPGDSAGDDCHGEAPLIETMVVDDGGEVEVVDTGETFWTVRFSVDARDENDGDLDVVTFRAWWKEGTEAPDTTLDPNFVSEPREGSKGLCAAWKHDASARVALPRDDLAFETHYTFAVTIADSGGLWAEPAVNAHTTCMVDGTPGG